MSEELDVLCDDCKAKSADCAYGQLRGGQSCVDTRARFSKVKLAIIGSRSFSNYDYLCNKIFELVGLKKVSEIVSGGAKGADSLGALFARDNNIPCTVIKPDWTKNGRAAGVIRNTEIIKISDVIIAFWDGSSRGTRDSIFKARAAKKKLFVVEYLKG